VSKVKINKIVIEIGNQKISLSPEEAKELREVLNDLYGYPKKEYEILPIFPEPYTAPRKQWWEDQPLWFDSSPKITYTDDNTAHIKL
jgi:hypothetical protein